MKRAPLMSCAWALVVAGGAIQHRNQLEAAEGQVCVDNRDCGIQEACLHDEATARGTCRKSCSPPLLDVVQTSVEDYTGSDGSRYRRFNLSVRNWKDLPVDMFQAAPDLPPCGANANASRSWLDIFDASNDRKIYGFCNLDATADLEKSPWFAVPVGDQPPAGIYVKLTDRRLARLYCSSTVQVPF